MSPANPEFARERRITPSIDEEDEDHWNGPEKEETCDRNNFPSRFVSMTAKRPARAAYSEHRIRLQE